MVVLQVCAFAAPTPGNFIPSLLSLERKLLERGIETIYAFPERARDKKWCKKIQKRTKVYFLPEARARIKIQTYKIFKTIYSQNQVSIVHSHFELYDIPATITAPKSVKIIWHLHDALKENYYDSSFIRKVLTKIQYGLVSHKVLLLSVSKEHADFAKKLGLKKENVKYLPNGIQTSRIDINKIDQCKIKNYALMFGWEVYRKGVDVLVDAISLLSNGIRVKIVGQDACEKYLSEVDLKGKVEFSKPVSDINSLYEEAIVFIHISRAEGLSYALLEALYAGLPVICSDIPENLFAKEFRNIIWVRSGNSKDVRKALEAVTCGTWEIQQEDINYNRELIINKYSIDNWLKQVEKFYLN